jgi:hypothetical protein
MICFGLINPTLKEARRGLFETDIVVVEDSFHNRRTHLIKGRSLCFRDAFFFAKIPLICHQQ